MRFQIILISVLLLSLPLAYAESLQVDVKPQRIETRSGTPISFDVSITNNNPQNERILFNILGNRIWWMQDMHILLGVEGSSTKTFRQGFYPTNAEPGTYSFVAFARSFDDPSISDTKEFFIEILPPTKFSSLTVKGSGEKAVADLTIDTVEEMELNIIFTVADSRKNPALTFNAQERILPGIATISREFPLKNLPPGQYSVRAYAGDLSAETRFEVKEVRQLDKRVQTRSNAWNDEVIITVTNNGNVPDQFRTEENFGRGDLVTGLVTSPTKCIESGDSRECSYELSLLPGDTKEIRYRTEYWPIYARSFSILLVTIALGAIVIGKLSIPRVRKDYKKRRQHTSVFLTVKNSYRHSKNVMVRDHVSPLASIVMEEFESVRPRVRRTEEGTDLIWKLGEMKPREIRMLSYKIKPIVHGHLKMPAAMLRYHTKKGPSKRIFSNRLEIE